VQAVLRLDNAALDALGLLRAQPYLARAIERGLRTRELERLNDDGQRIGGAESRIGEARRGGLVLWKCNARRPPWIRVG
jgi:hypothetical protein